MPLKKNNPGCRCCAVPCIDWANSPPDEIQLVLPAGCQRAGTHLLDRVDVNYILDCPTSTLGGIDVLCAGYQLLIGTGDAQDQLYVNVGITAGGDTVIIAAICNETGSISDTDAGTLWGMIAGISDWNDLDGLTLPFTNRREDVEGQADCSTDDDCELLFVP